MRDSERGLVADVRAPVHDLDAALPECPVDRQAYGARHDASASRPGVQREADVRDRGLPDMDVAGESPPADVVNGLDGPRTMRAFVPAPRNDRERELLG